MEKTEAKVKEITPKDNTPKTMDAIKQVNITCIDCGAIRTVGKGEGFQVKRCVKCQAIHRKALRKAYKKNRIQQLRERVEGLEAFITGAGLQVPTAE
jgi:hypothetical protein